MTKTHTCAWLGQHGKSCPRLAEPGTSRCAEHTQQRKDGRWAGPERGSDERSQRARLRRERVALVGERCERCGATEVPLQCHHVKPISPTTTVDDVKMLCRPCHKAVDPFAR